ncbi:MAG: mercury methylation corrinoid protein HgcA [bacterium]
MRRQYIVGSMGTEAGEVPRVSTELGRADKWGTFRVALAIRRMNYTVDPGIYAVGSPDQHSIVLVSANYKLSFDTLRQELNGLDAWIMVLDTKGINVWCAAGKGTFGTSEVVNRIEVTGLKKIVSHRKIIVPQLGAAGVAAHEVKKLSGFTVVYGPVRASDIRSFLEADMVATRQMRRVTFSFYDRARLVPTEVVTSLPHLLIATAVFLLLAGFSRSGYSGSSAVSIGARSSLNLFFVYLAGTVLGPLFLPWLPGRAFSSKGFFLGLILFVVLSFGRFAGTGLIEIVGWMLLIPMISSFIVMNFTGSSTYTSLSGVKKEMRVALPLQIAAAVAGLAFWVAGRFV